VTGLDAIVLDLDDTLFDTSAKLLPAADRRAVAVLRGRGLAIAEEAALGRIAALRRAGVAEVFRALAAEEGLDASAAADAERAFFRYEVPPISLDEDTAAALDDLATLAPLALLTTGDPPTQRAKAERLGLSRWFAVEEFVGFDAPGGKAEALRRLVAAHGWTPARTVFAGDRPDGDVRAANRAGCLAVLVRREGAEFSEVRADGPEGVPWRTIGHVRELPALLRAELARGGGGDR
jgi:FMN phosphatase YigB (HAD superfamily)